MNDIRKQLARREIAKFQKSRAPQAPEPIPLQNRQRVSGPLDLHDYRTLASAGLIQPYSQFSFNDGNKFFGGFGPTTIFITDYWSLREKSAQLFTENLYARGIIRRLVTNIINTGLWPESQPIEAVLGLAEDSLADWTEEVENRFYLWGNDARVCDYYGLSKWSKLQQVAKLEAMVCGDVLVVIRQDSGTKMPKVQLFNGNRVMSPGNRNVPAGHTVQHGVELDRLGKQVAFWIKNDRGEYERLEKYGSRGRLNAFLVYGSDKRMDEVRGEPLLSIILQSLKEIDRYRDSAQRKAVINSMLAMVVEKSEDKPGTRPLTGGAVRRDSTTVTDQDGTPRTYNLSTFNPGIIIDELQQGEKIHGFDTTGIDLDFGGFEESIIQSVAWCLEIPPEILRLAFSNNYSASQAAINEFKIFLNRERKDFGDDFCCPIYVDWLISETLNRKINAAGLLESWRDPAQYEIFGAWIVADWSGAIKPSTDIVKTAKGYKIQVDEHFISRERACREVSGQKLSKVIKANKKANEKIVEAMLPMLELKEKLSEKNSEDDIESRIDDRLEALVDQIAELAIEKLTEDVSLK